MSDDALRAAVGLAARLGRALVATAGADGLPHLAVARRLTLEGGGTVSATEWFCPGTVSNVAHSPLVSVVVWDELRDVGFQILGAVEGMEDLAMLDGYSPGDAPLRVPQVERALRIRVQKVLRFSQAPHSDEEE
jgi:uncharacterized protein